MKRREQFRFALVHTGQHYDKMMSDFSCGSDLPQPDVSLEVGRLSRPNRGDHAEVRTSSSSKKPDWVVGLAM
jgi:UDP-N-acetylglucosamine 2-epimerase